MNKSKQSQPDLVITKLNKNASVLELNALSNVSIEYALLLLITQLEGTTLMNLGMLD